MKRIRSILAFAILLLTTISCTKDVLKTLPEIKIVADSNFVFSDTILSMGQNYLINVRIQKTAYNLTNFVASLDTGNGFVSVFDTGMNTPAQTIWLNLTKTPADTDFIRLLVRDLQGNLNETTLKIMLNKNQTFSEIIHLANIRLYPPKHYTQRSFYSFSLFETLTFDSAWVNQNKADLFYYFGTTDNNTLASPGANVEDAVFSDSLASYNFKNWQIRNTLYFKQLSMSSIEFDQIETDSALIVSYGIGQGKRKAKSLTKNDVYSFKTPQSKYGILRINEIGSGDQGFLAFDIKIQK